MHQQVFLPKRNKGDKLIVSRIYRGRYKFDGDAKPTEISLGVTDETLARQKLAAIVQEQEQEREGIIAPKIQREAAKQTLSAILEDFIKSRESLGRDHKYLMGVKQQMQCLIKEAGWKLLRNVTLDSFEKWRSQKNYSPKTLNEYLATANVFLNWMFKTGRLTTNPLRMAEKVSASNYEKRTRRAITWEQLQNLQRVSEGRGTIYIVAACTGLRRGELGKLQWRDIKLEGDRPTIHARASTTKNGRKASLPLHPYAVEAIKKLQSTEAMPLDLVFSGKLPRIERYRRDLKEAGIPYVDAEGRVFDFHALRVTFATLLASNGASPRDTMELMRHSDMRLTTQVYTDAGHLPLRSSILKLNSALQDTHIDTQNCTDLPKKLSFGDLEGMCPDLYEAVDIEGFRADYALNWLGGGPSKMVRGAGFEPATPAV